MGEGEGRGRESLSKHIDNSSSGGQLFLKKEACKNTVFTAQTKEDATTSVSSINHAISI